MRKNLKEARQKAGEEVVGMALSFIAGFATGLMWYKVFIFQLVKRIDHTACDYCEFQVKRDELFGRKKK